MAEKWLRKEIELNAKHEELLMRREALLRSTNRYHDSQDARLAKLVATLPNSKARNENLRKKLTQLSRDVKEQKVANSPRFETIRKNYWSMVKSVFPVWYDQYIEEMSAKTNPAPSVDANYTFPVNPASTSPKLSARATPRTPRTPHTPNFDYDDASLAKVPPLDLDFIDEISTSRNATPHLPVTVPSMTTPSKPNKKEKRVHYDEAQLSAAAAKK